MSLFKGFRWMRANPYETMGMAAQLGIERRQNFRINYPEGGAIGDLPSVTFMGNNFVIGNISVGGCALHDPNEILGPAVGQEVTLSLHWDKDSQDVKSRVVSRVHKSRHIQFMNLSEKNQLRIKKHIEPGFRGSSLRRVDSSSSPHLKMEACEIWISVMEDGVTLFDHPHLIASVLYRGIDYFCYRGAFPVYGSDRKRLVPPLIYENLVVMLANVPNPSPALKKFATELCQMGQERFR